MKINLNNVTSSEKFAGLAEVWSRAYSADNGTNVSSWGRVIDANEAVDAFIKKIESI